MCSQVCRRIALKIVATGFQNVIWRSSACASIVRLRLLSSSHFSAAAFRQKRFAPLNMVASAANTAMVAPSN